MAFKDVIAQIRNVRNVLWKASKNPYASHAIQKKIIIQLEANFLHLMNILIVLILSQKDIF